MDHISGGDVSGRIGRLDKKSIDVPNFLCCVCTKENKRSEAVENCITCEDYYCEECVKLHDKVPTLSGHVIVDKSDFKGTGGENKLPSIPTERCAAHPAKIVDMYCETHDRVGCATCMASTHGESCTKLYIPENIDFLFDIEKITHSEQHLRFAIQKVEAALRFRDICLQDVHEVVDDARKQLEDYTDRLIKTVNELKQKTRDRLDAIRIELESVLSGQMSALHLEMVAAKDILQKTTRANSECNNKSQQITCSNLAAISAKKCKDANRSLVCPDVKDILFQPHVTCEKLFEKLLLNNSLGKFSTLHSCKRSVCVPLKIKKKEKKSVNVKSAVKHCDINGSCTLQDGTILLADYNEDCLKRLSPRATSVSDCLDFSGHPWSVAAINQKQAAVTLPEQKQVHIIALDRTMNTTRTLKLDFMCYGISHCNNELFISDRNTLYVYTVAGKLLRKFPRASTGRTLFFNIYNMAVCDSCRFLFVADYYKGLIAVDKRSGRQLWHYSGDDLVRAACVCLDGRGGLFVCGEGSNNILHFSESGEKIGEIVNGTDGIYNPESVCFISVTSTLVVTQYANNVALEYQLTT